MERPFSDRLPLTVEKWARLEIAALETNDLALRPPQPLHVQRGDRSLHIRLATANDKSLYCLVFRAEDPTLQLKKLSSFGLGPRATEVLYWITKGKTNVRLVFYWGCGREPSRSTLSASCVR
jgi:hypothetical protein